VTLRTLIVDDEAASRRRIRRLLERERDVTVIGESADGVHALETVRRESPDLVFLDVQMPELDGFEVIARLAGGTLPCVIFVTAYDRYAMRAFDVHAIDYLLKPFAAARFQVALERARARIRSQQVDAGLVRFVAAIRDRTRYLSRVSVKSGGRIVLVDLSTVDWIEADDNYVRLHCGQREYTVRETLNALEKQLDPEMFIRIHRSTVVRIDRIREFHPATHGDMDVVLRDGTQLTLSRTWRARARHLIGE
jgi:two-component system LytT family response regulator